MSESEPELETSEAKGPNLKFAKIMVAVLGVAILAMIVVMVVTVIVRMDDGVKDEANVAADGAAADGADTIPVRPSAPPSKTPSSVPVGPPVAMPAAMPVAAPAEPWRTDPDLQPGERITDTALSAGRIMLTVRGTDQSTRIVLFDAATGARLGEIAGE